MNRTVMVVLILGLTLSACNLTTDEQLSEPMVRKSTGDVTTVLSDEFWDESSKHVLAVYESDGFDVYDVGRLYHIRIEPTDMLYAPIAGNLDDIFVSDLGTLVWMDERGVMALKKGNTNPERIYEAGTYLVNNPYLMLHPTKEVVGLIDDDGLIFHQIDLDSGDDQAQLLPKPYGTEFRYSPDGSAVVFVTGFDPNLQRPLYHYQHMQGSSYSFETDGELALRSAVAWSRDGDAVYTLGQNGEIWRHVLGQTDVDSSLWMSVDGVSSLVAIERVGDLLMVESAGKDWYVIDEVDASVMNEIPYLITQGMTEATIIPWTEARVLIEETIRDANRSIRRLWVSDFRGAKDLLIPNYFEAETIYAE